MVGVVAKHAVESGVAVLEAAHVHWNHSDARQQRLVAHKLTSGAGDATDEHISRFRHVVDIVHYLKFYIRVGFESLDKQFCLLFVLEQFHLEMLFGFGFKNAEQGCARGVAKPNKSVGLGTGFTQSLSRNSCHRSSAHGGNPVGIHQRQQFA